MSQLGAQAINRYIDVFCLGLGAQAHLVHEQQFVVYFDAEVVRLYDQCVFGVLLNRSSFDRIIDLLCISAVIVDFLYPVQNQRLNWLLIAGSGVLTDRAS